MRNEALKGWSMGMGMPSTVERTTLDNSGKVKICYDPKKSFRITFHGNFSFVVLFEQGIILCVHLSRINHLLTKQ